MSTSHSAAKSVDQDQLSKASLTDAKCTSDIVQFQPRLSRGQKRGAPPLDRDLAGGNNFSFQKSLSLQLTFFHLINFLSKSDEPAPERSAKKVADLQPPTKVMKKSPNEFDKDENIPKQFMDRSTGE